MKKIIIKRKFLGPIEEDYFRSKIQKLDETASLSCSSTVTTSNAESNEPKVTHKVWLGIEIGGEKLGNIVIGLFGKVVPKTVENFLELTKKPEGQGYRKSFFHRVVQNFIIEGGNITRENGET